MFPGQNSNKIGKEGETENIHHSGIESACQMFIPLCCFEMDQNVGFYRLSIIRTWVLCTVAEFIQWAFRNRNNDLWYSNMLVWGRNESLCGLGQFSIQLDQ